MKQPYRTPRGRLYGHPARWLIEQTEFPISDQETWSVYAPAAKYWNVSLYLQRPFNRSFGTPAEAFAYVQEQLAWCAQARRLHGRDK